ncbi:hypothetical protein SDC9_195343 [bioreactor metagenome]|uniref:Uncharacterized protein n=1 Tax=bioreactor metagenome TaxID=1076179 RepID=A0A645IBC2_9ZZZZ
MPFDFAYYGQALYAVHRPHIINAKFIYGFGVLAGTCLLCFITHRLASLSFLLVSHARPLICKNGRQKTAVANLLLLFVVGTIVKIVKLGKEIRQ